MMRNTIIAAAVIGLVLVLGAVWLLSGGKGRGPASESGEDEVINKRASSGGGSEGFLSSAELERLMSQEGGPTAQARYEAYRSYARYPDNSRPLNKDMVDLLKPWKVKMSPLPILADGRITSETRLKEAMERMRAEGKSEEEIKAELTKDAKDAPIYLFDVNKHTITAGDELDARLTVTSATGTPLDITVLDTAVMADPIFGEKGLGSAQSSQEGTGAYRFTWKAPSDAKAYWGSLTLLVRARVPGKGEVTLRQNFYSSPLIPARFTGNFSERLDEGSLVIDVELDVKRECRYSIHANLINLDQDEPTHWVSVDKVLKTGKQTISFVFFGKIFRDGGHQGKFQMRDLRGTCENLPFPASWLGDPTRLRDIEKAAPKKEPNLLYIPYTDKSFTTREYALEDFSDREHESEHKRNRLARLKQLAGIE